MRVGYARTSTIDQQAGFDAQVRDLEAAGCEKVFKEQVSSVGQREQLAVLLDFIREGDTLVVTKLDWLARSIGHLSEIIEHLDAKKADLQVLAMNLDTSTATGRLMLNVIGSVAQFEREMMLERQCEGIARAKSEGKYKGRASTARAKSADVLALKAQGLGGTEIAKRLGIGRASVYRVLGEPAYRLRAPRRRAAGATSRALFSPGTGEVPRLLPFRMALVGVQGDEQAEEEQPA